MFSQPTETFWIIRQPIYSHKTVMLHIRLLLLRPSPPKANISGDAFLSQDLILTPDCLQVTYWSFLGTDGLSCLSAAITLNYTNTVCWLYILTIRLVPAVMLWHQPDGVGEVWARLFPFVLFQPDCRVEHEMSRFRVWVNIEVSNTVELEI